MTQLALPERTIVVIEDTEILREGLITEMGRVASGNRVRGFCDGEAVLKWLSEGSNQRDTEIILVVGDSVGMPFMKAIGKGRRYNGAQKILYSGNATALNVAEWKNAGVIDWHIAKGYRAELMEKVSQCVRDYNRDVVLADMRSYIDTKCWNPAAPYYTCDDGRILNIIELYHEILDGTVVGKTAAEDWIGMREAEKAKG